MNEKDLDSLCHAKVFSSYLSYVFIHSLVMGFRWDKAIWNSDAVGIWSLSNMEFWQHLIVESLFVKQGVSRE